MRPTPAEIAAALRRTRPDWLPRVYPNGKVENGTFFLGNADGEAGRSLPIPLAVGKGEALADFAGGFQGDDLDLYARGRRLELSEAMAEAASFLGLGGGPSHRANGAGSAQPKAPTDVEKAETSHRLWRRAVTDSDALDRYLTDVRGIPKPVGGWPDAVRFHPDAPYGFAAGRHLPALLMPKSDRAGRICGLHAVFLKPGGSGKADVSPSKKSFGAGGVVIVRASGETVLACEGPEDALSLAVAVPDAAVVCTAGAGTLHRVANHLPPETKRVVLVADRDAAGHAGAEKAAAMIHNAGVSVAIALPPEGVKDVNDLLRMQGVEALKIMLKDAAPFAKAGDGTDASDAQDALGNGSVLELISAASIIPRPIHWLWDGWLAQGKLHILAGSPGTGKTTIALSMAATITTGERWPDGSTAAKGDVLIWSGEDNPTDALVPRLLASGADLNRIHFVVGVRDGDRVRPFDPAADMAKLAAAMARLPNLHLLVIDPIVSAVSGDSHKNAEVRRGLQPLVDLAQQAGVAVLGISHFTKGTAGRDPTERVTGSLAFGALARLVMCTAKPAEDGAKRRLVRAKSNIGPDGSGFEYDLVQTPLPSHSGIIGQAVCWGDALEGSARTLLAEVETIPDDGDTGALAKAEAFLRNLLANGPMPADKVKTAAKEAGAKWATVRRAKEALGIVPIKRGMSGGWWWVLPSDPPEDAHPASVDAQHETMSTFGKNEHLRRCSSLAEDAHQNGGKPEGAHPQSVRHPHEHLRPGDDSEEGTAWEAML